eukprot:CAMPEP_0206523430 /NCGR_PEP_ID=MMETSP0324_2-20121206/67614_1 /ASSEMBLY_ACC=CAM_ASM_000836 /TAXON_ID=2866 /ORGANISM="Crypthecodinium cohnii, Strain Seligo" /LENGTH=63 /DNA_ID=CAMNT_0054017865 /DNA_START=369 /DNA_END=557 /DNA_ORIENTATION=-
MTSESLSAAGPVLVEIEGIDQRSDRGNAPLRRWRDGYGGSGRLDDIYRFDFPARCWQRIEVQG